MSKRPDIWAANAAREIINDTLSRYDIPSDAYESDTAIDGDCVRLADMLLAKIGRGDYLEGWEEGYKSGRPQIQSYSGGSIFHSLRRRVAAALHSEGGKASEDFHAMSKDRQAPWLADADRVIPIVIEACARVADARNPEKPTEYLICRELIASHMKGLFVGHPDWECPIGRDDCFQNCGSYGCGN